MSRTQLSGYLFELAQLFTTFYDQCPVLKAEESVRDSRLALCALALRRLSGGLELLGIETPETCRVRRIPLPARPLLAASTAVEVARIAVDTLLAAGVHQVVVSPGIALGAHGLRPGRGRKAAPDGWTCWSGSTKGPPASAALGLALSAGARPPS